ncbi:MAG: InlB B-repeat-containing protein, partial [Acholeplasmataceae bacterium]|nr:InlB B-repeat-containing protein [Acholeplasmataceae bacterium]
MKKIFGGMVLFIVAALLFGCKSKTVKVTFDSNGGSIVEEVTLKKGALLELPEEPKLLGHKFIEWQLDGVKFSEEAKVTANITLVAKWGKLKYTITFDSDGGSDVSPLVKEYGEKLTTLPAPTKDNQAFDGWYIGDAKVELPYTVNKNVTLKARWATEEKTVSFYADDVLLEAKVVPHGSSITLLEGPVKENHLFDGWYDGDTKVESPYIVTKDVTLKAKWVLEERTVSYYVDGDLHESVVVSLGSTITLLEAPVKEEYDFIGWYVGEELYVVAPVTEDLRLDARYKEKTYQVNFIFDGPLGEGSATQVATYAKGEPLLYGGKPLTTKIFSHWEYEGAIAPFGEPVTKSMEIRAVYAKTHVGITDGVIPAMKAISVPELFTDVVLNDTVYYYSVSENKLFKATITGIATKGKEVEYALKGEAVALKLAFPNEEPAALASNDVVFANDQVRFV